ncbi:hypothetical protein MNBD_GAMMA08-2566 [hydrothermal vent metagenome]|uniref:Uncharacterized protein n=1 Tax=hydrothermal vent metagenome TaxID=652676 RepID=A0A3B0XR67_9ZZZZ
MTILLHNKHSPINESKKKNTLVTAKFVEHLHCVLSMQIYKSMNRCNPHPNPLPKVEGITTLLLSLPLREGITTLLLPLPLGEGWGEGSNSLSRQSINSNINTPYPLTNPFPDKSVQCDDLKSFTNVLNIALF